jgi:DNA replicative helicase MCM subunit Mcm2 (Cdc46/Mcm family)
MCQNFTYGVVGQGRRLKAIKKNLQLKKIVAQKINVILFVEIIVIYATSAITFLARVAHIFSTIEQKNDKQQSCVKNAMNTHFLHDRRQMRAIKTLLH